MFEITPKTSNRQMLRFLEDSATKNELTAVCIHIQKNSDEDVTTYGTKQQLLCGLESVDKVALADAIESVFPSEEEDSEEEDFDEDPDESEDEDFDGEDDLDEEE